METQLFCIAVAAAYAVNFLVAWALAWAFTEWRGPLLPFKPFNCRGCMSFWLTVIPGVALAYALSGPIEVEQIRQVIRFLLSLVAVLSGLINYLYIKSKFKVYE